MKLLSQPKTLGFFKKFVVILTLVGFSLATLTSSARAQSTNTLPGQSNYTQSTQPNTSSTTETNRKTAGDLYRDYLFLKGYYSNHKVTPEDQAIYDYYQKLAVYFHNAKASTTSITLADGKVLGIFDIPFVDIPTPPLFNTVIGVLNPLNWDDYVKKGIGCITDPAGCAKGAVLGSLEEITSGILRAVAEIPIGILKVVFDNILVILQKLFFFTLEIVTGFLGFSIRGILGQGFCAFFFNNGSFNPIVNIIGVNNQNPEAVSRLNAFTLMDFGFNGLYKSIPSVGPVSNFAAVINHDVLGISTANAQGVGTDALGSGIQSIWAKIRDATLVFMVLVLVGIGFMVMLRKRLDPRTVVTATNSLPKIAIALILIVFSFAISGLFIDLIWLMVGIVRSYFGNNLFGGFVGAFGGEELVWFPVFSALTFSTIFNWGAFLCSNPLLLAPFLASPFALLGILILVMVVEFFLRLLLIIVGVYLFWILLKNYAYMIVFTIFSPVFFLLGALPGFEGVTVSWFKRMLVYALAFPIVVIMLYIAVAMLGLNTLGIDIHGVQTSAPPPIKSTLVNIPYLIGIGIIFFATKVPQFLESVFKVGGMDIRGGIGPGALLMPVAAPLAAAQKLGKVSGPIMAVTGSAGVALAQKGGVRGFVGQGLGLVHDAVRPFGGNTNQYDSTGDPSKVADRTFKQKLQGQYLIRNARGDIVKQYMDAGARAKERFIEEHIATKGDPALSYDDNKKVAEMDFNDHYSKGTGAPGLTPGSKMTPAQVSGKLNTYADTLRAKGLTESQVDAELDKFIKNDFTP